MPTLMYCKMPYLSLTSLGTCGNAGFLVGGRRNTVIYTKNKVPESLT